MSEEQLTRRDILKKAVYVTPAILTLTTAPSFASGGSGQDDDDHPAPRGFGYGVWGQDKGDHPAPQGFGYGAWGQDKADRPAPRGFAYGSSKGKGGQKH